MRSVVTGGAGFIGSHLVRALAAAGDEVVVYDRKNGDEISNTERLITACQGADRIYHLASNADIAASAKDPTIDFYEGSFLTQQVLEASRIARVPEFVYASGSGVYGEEGDFSEVYRPEGNIEPISTYGASKLAGEALVSAYCHMFGIRGVSFRFANVVGPNQTHGVGFDFVRKLRHDPTHLKIRGNGKQTKPYLYVNDAVDVMLVGPEPGSGTDLGYDVFNVATEDRLTVDEIATMAILTLGLENVERFYDLDDRGWIGDVPDVEMNCDKLGDRAWKPTYSSVEAMALALEALANEHR